VLILSEEEAANSCARGERLPRRSLPWINPCSYLASTRRFNTRNTAAIKEYRYEANEIAGLSVDDFVVASVEISPRQTIPAIPSDKPLWIGEHIHRRSDGSEFPAAVTLSHIRDGSDNIVGLVIGIRNLTEETKGRRPSRTHGKAAAIGELVAGVAHEL